MIPEKKRSRGRCISASYVIKTYTLETNRYI